MEILPPIIRVLLPPQSPKSLITPLLIIPLILSLTISQTTSTTPPDFSEIPYSLYCNDVVHELPISGFRLRVPPLYLLRLKHATFNSTKTSHQNAVTYRSDAVYKTDSPTVLKISGAVRFVGPGTEGLFGNLNRQRRLRRMVYRPRKGPIRGFGYRYPTSFRVYGYWDSNSGNLCMVGSGVSSLSTKNVVLMLHYPNSSTIVTSLVNGTLQSLEQVGSDNYFNPVSILGVSVMGYNYSLIDREVKNGGFSGYDGGAENGNVSLSLPSGHWLCSLLNRAGAFDLVYGNDCDGSSCVFLNRSGEGLVRYIYLKDFECLEDGKGRYLLGFFNSSVDGYMFPFNPNTTLVAEGAWDVYRKRLELVACEVVSDKASLNMGLIGD